MQTKNFIMSIHFKKENWVRIVAPEKATRGLATVWFREGRKISKIYNENICLSLNHLSILWFEQCIAVGAWDHMEGREEYRSTLAHRQVLYSVINTSCTFYDTFINRNFSYFISNRRNFFLASFWDRLFDNREERKTKRPRHTVVVKNS